MIPSKVRKLKKKNQYGLLIPFMKVAITLCTSLYTKRLFELTWKRFEPSKDGSQLFSFVNIRLVVMLKYRASSPVIKTTWISATTITSMHRPQTPSHLRLLVDLWPRPYVKVKDAFVITMRSLLGRRYAVFRLNTFRDIFIFRHLSLNPITWPVIVQGQGLGKRRKYMIHICSAKAWQ